VPYFQFKDQRLRSPDVKKPVENEAYLVLMVTYGIVVKFETFRIKFETVQEKIKFEKVRKQL